MVVRVIALLVAAALTAPLAAQQPARPEAAALAAVTAEFMKTRMDGGGAAGPSIERVREQAAAARAVLTKLAAIDTSKLSHDEWITHALLTFEAELQRDEEPFYWLDFRVTPYASPLARVLTARFAAMPVATAADRLAYLDALYRLPGDVAAHEARLRSQAARGIVLPAAEIDLVAPFVASIVADPASSAFAMSPARLATVPEADRAAFRSAVDDAVRTAIVPAVARLASFIDGPYRAQAVEDVGVSQYPDGAAYYAYLIRRHTSLNLSPEAIHQIGLDEIARLTRELDAARVAAGFTGTLDAFRTFLKTDRRFFAKNSDEFGEIMMAAIRRIEPRVGELFIRTPKAPYGVLRLDPALEASMTFGFYQLPSAAEPRGLYRFNGSKSDERSVLMADALIFHELVPGHHFQMALRNENTRLSPFRRGAQYTTFTEGWAEYASDLAGEIGMYADPYDRAGRLSMDLFLSSRLVVDTGMNALGWSRERAMQYMRDNTFHSEGEIATETLRYSTDIPGQALAYKMGAMKIHELRKRAQERLGASFDLRQFHDYVLDGGPMPLSVLEMHLACLGGEKHRGGL
jgi:uncharacterized protein (DUF885 family)